MNTSGTIWKQGLVDTWRTHTHSQPGYRGDSWTYLFPYRLAGQQLRLNSNEQLDKCPFALAARGIVNTIIAVVTLLTVTQQHRRYIHLECPINLPDDIVKTK